MDRRETVEVFRTRLAEVIRDSGLSRSAFAAAVGMDRSTLSQLLSPANDRLPRADTIAMIAAQRQVSVDWLLGLSQEGQLSAGMMTQALEIESGAGSPTDARLLRWFAEATGYKIRYTPSTLPDLLKTEEIIRYEYRDYAAEVPEMRIEQAEARRAYTRRPETDMECCSAYQYLAGFARGEGIWRRCPLEARLAQLRTMVRLLDEFYPTFRWFLYDGLRHFSVPMTIFGPQRAAVYAGDMYIVFNSTEHIRALTQHFEDLIRGAILQPPQVAGMVAGLLREAEGGEPAPSPLGGL
jgi:transcriptional regulator with XRE-family HTH domain